MKLSDNFVSSGGHFGDFVAHITPFSAPITRNFYIYELKCILISSNQTYNTILAILGHVQVEIIRKTNIFVTLGPIFFIFNHFWLEFHHFPSL